MEHSFTIKKPQLYAPYVLLTWVLFENVIYQTIAFICVKLHDSNYSITGYSIYYVIFGILLVWNIINKLRLNPYYSMNVGTIVILLLFTAYYIYTKTYYPDHLSGTAHEVNFLKIALVYFPAMIIAAHIDDFFDWINSLKRINIILNLLGIYFLQRLLNTGKTDESMDMAYIITLCALFCIYFWNHEKFSIFKVVLSAMIILDFIYLLLAGCRGAFLVFASYIAIIEIKKVLTIDNLKKKLGIILGILLLLVMLFFLYLPFVTLLSTLLGNTRMISFLLTGTTSTDGGRSIVQTMITNNFYKLPTLGFGFMGDQYLTSGLYYAHNIELEFICDFGWYVGIGFIAAILILFIRGMKNTNIRECALLLGSYVLIQLQFSSSYLLQGTFWLLLGVLVNKIARENINYATDIIGDEY